MNKSKWLLARFKANLDDYRPVKWPPPGPFWCSGYGEDYAIVIAYVKTEAQVKEYWPEAKDIDAAKKEEVTFSDRFPKPNWWSMS